VATMAGAYFVGTVMEWKCDELVDLYKNRCNYTAAGFECGSLLATRIAVCGGAKIATGKLIYEGLEWMAPAQWFKK
jgi:hypothetical protein